MRDMLEARKRGDLAFRDKDFRTAIDCYSQVIYLIILKTVYQYKEIENTIYILYIHSACYSSNADCNLQFVDVGTMISPTVYARRSLCYLMCDQPDAALRDAMQAQCVYPDWSTAFYMQAVALAKLDMQKDAADMLNEASMLEEKRQRGGKG